jgi:hypothetical protein
MIGFTAPNQYQPRAKWHDKLDSWAQSGTPNAGSWQADITLYWRWTTLEHRSLIDAWTSLRMQPVNARSSLDPDSADRGLIPPELFSRVLARSHASVIDPNDNAADVIITPEPAPGAAAAVGESHVGYTPPNRYRPRAKWRNKLDSWAQNGTPNAGSWQADMTLYWRWTTLDHRSPMEAWASLRMRPINARSSLDPNSADIGLIPPELFSRVLARSRATFIDPNDDVPGVIIDPEPTS